MTKYDAEGQENGLYYYVDEANLDAAGASEPGWYGKQAVEDEEADNDPAGEVIVAFGEGVKIDCDTSAKVTFAGQVLDTNEPFALKYGAISGYDKCTYIGNCSPRNRTLSEFGITTDGLIGSQSLLLTRYDAEGQENGLYYYVDEANIDAAGASEPGWYGKQAVEDEEADNDPAGSVEIQSGEMFKITCDSVATLIVPSAL